MTSDQHYQITQQLDKMNKVLALISDRLAELTGESIQQTKTLKAIEKGIDITNDRVSDVNISIQSRR